MTAAIVASVIGGIVAVGLSLPLRSPDDVFFNAATVALGAASAGVIAALAWQALAGHVARFRLAMVVLFLLGAAAAFAGEQAFEGMLTFALPLVAVVLVTIVVLTPLLARRALPAGAMAAVIPLLAIGFALAGQGDTDARALTLPATSNVTPAPGGATAPASATTPGSATPVAASTPAASTGSASAARFRTPADVRGVVFTVGQGSEAQFTVREKLAQLPLPNDATMQTSALTGEVRLDGTSTVRLDLQQLSSDQSRRDNFVRRQFSRDPIATVTIDSLGDALPAQYTTGEVVKRQVGGKLRIMGNEAPITFDVEARLEGSALSILGRTTFRWADYKIPPPNVAGTVQVEDQVNVVVLVVAKAASWRDRFPTASRYRAPPGSHHHCADRPRRPAAWCPQARW